MQHLKLESSTFHANLHSHRFLLSYCHLLLSGMFTCRAALGNVMCNFLEESNKVQLQTLIICASCYPPRCIIGCKCHVTCCAHAEVLSAGTDSSDRVGGVSADAPASNLRCKHCCPSFPSGVPPELLTCAQGPLSNKTPRLYCARHPDRDTSVPMCVYRCNGIF